MKWNKKVIRLIAMSLSLLLMLTACQVPEGVEVPSGVSIPSDLSDLTSEELEQLESYLEDTETSVESELTGDSDETGNEDQQTDADVADKDDAGGAEDTADVKADAEEETDEAKSTVILPSGRDWVKYILDVAEYKRAYKDLQAAFGNDWDAYVDHYLTKGLYEGRDQGKLFDPWAYAEAYPDVKEECGDDANKIIEHYVTFGIKENRPIGTTEGYEDFADKISREAMVGEAIDRTPSSRLEALTKHADNVLLYGRNVEGSLYPQLFVDGIDPVTKEHTIWNKFTPNKMYYNSNLYGQTLLLKMLEGMTWITGEEKYQDAAYEQVQFRYDTPELLDKNGLFYTGPHALVDVKEGRMALLQHETKEDQLPLELYNRVDPEGFKRFVTAYWNSHIYDTSCLDMNRHGEFDKDMANGDFWSSDYTNPSPWYLTESAGFFITAMDMIDAAYYLTEVTGDPIYQTWGERLLDKYLYTTDPNTGFFNTQIGLMYSDNDDYTDRWIHSFHGADFVDNAGTDYKTLTEDDYLLANEGMHITRIKLRYMTGAVIQNFVHYYETTGQQKLYDLIKNYMLGFVRYAYDAGTHSMKTPILTNGTDLNPGEGNGPILVAPRAGYFGKEGSVQAENEAIQKQSLVGLIETAHLLKNEDAAERAEIWEAARAFARFEGLGDIGTALGENVNVNLQTDATDVYTTIAVVTLYKYTGNQQYYDLAVKMADNIIKAYFDEEAGLFISNKKAPYAQFGNTEMYAVYCVEAMTRGLLDQINLDYSLASIEMPHDGMGTEVNDGDVFYSRSEVKVKKVDLGAETYALVLDENPSFEITDVSGHENESAIRQMVALGVMGVDEQGSFAPENTVTRGELVQIVVDLFGFDNTTVPTDFRFTDVTGKPYYEAVVIAENAGILDANMGTTLFDGDKIVTREEMASIIVKALQKKLPENTWYVANSLYRIQDADTISAWAKEYADIATNYRLMVDITEDIFRPKTDVTKAMVADVFQNICRYMELPQLQKLTATITPHDADRQVITWESSDTSILEIDQQGRLYPLQTGSVIVTATTEWKTAQIEVIVSEREDWMIKEIHLNDELLENFNTNIRDYEKNLYLGTSTVPTVTAVSFSGEPVEVKLPEALPGRVELNVRGCDVKYVIDLDNTLVEYTIDENFNHKIGTLIENVITDKYNWFASGRAVTYLPFWKVIPRNWVNSNEEGYGCMAFPYRHELYAPSGAVNKLCIVEEYAYTFGPDQDDMLIIAEVEFAVKNMEDKVNGFNLYFSEQTSSGTRSVARFDIIDNEVRRRISSKTYNNGTTYPIEDDRFYQIRLVIDKKTGKFSYYMNGELLEKDVSSFSSTVSGLGCIEFSVPREAEYCNAEMFFDNIKVYELQRSYVEATMSQNPRPTHSPKPTESPNPAWVEFPVNETYDNYEVGTLATATAQDKGYDWMISGTVYPDLVKVVAKNTVDTEAESTDNCLEIPYDYAAGAGNHRLTLDENLMYKLGEAATDDKSIVIEMDVAIAGAGTKANGYRIYFSQRVGSGGTSSVGRIAIKEDSIARMLNSSGAVNTKKQYPMSKGEFAHMKVVINKQTKKFTYYINGTPVEVGVAPFSAGIPNFGAIYFTSQAETADVDSSMYIDNLKVYVEETLPEPTAAPLPTLNPTTAPTAAPTPAPTAVPGATPTVAPTAAPEETTEPYHVNLNFDDIALGTKVSSFTAGDVYFWNTAGRVGNGRVVAKTQAVADANASDRCLILTSGTLPGYYVLRLSEPIYLGEEAFKDSNLVVELDVAIIGTDASKSPMAWFYFGQNPTNDYVNQLTTFYLEHNNGADQWVRIDDLNTEDDTATTNRYVGPTVERGKFTTLKLVVNRGNGSNTCSYYWDGQLVETSTYNGAPFDESSFNKDSNWDGIEFSELKIGISKQLSTSDPEIYIDNIKIYTEAVSTVMPTTEPTAEPTTEPTAEPTAAPTVAPTAEPTTEPVLPPDGAPTATPNVASPVYSVNEDFNDIASIGTVFNKLTGGDGYSLAFSGKTGNTKVVSKSTVTGKADDADDLGILLASSSSGTGAYAINLGQAVALENEALGNSNLVVELDVALTGTTTTKTPIATIYFGKNSVTTTSNRIAAFELACTNGVDQWVRVNNGYKYTGPSIERGEIATLKLVINRGTEESCCSYYWKGQLVETSVYEGEPKDESSFKKDLKWNATEFDSIRIDLGKKVTDEDLGLYIDNLKIYTQ